MTATLASPPSPAARPLTTHPTDPVHVDLRRLLTPDADAGADDSRSPPGNDMNSNGRVFGGQLLGQAVAAAARTMGAQQRVAALQLVFLRGANVDEPLRFAVERLQDGRRYASRRIAGWQGAGLVFSAHVTAVSSPAAAPRAAPLPADLPRPDALRTHRELPAWLLERIGGTNFRLGGRDSLDFRLVDPEHELVPAQAGPSRLRYWIRAAQPLGDDPALHAAALAYLADYWLTYPAVAHRVTVLPQRPAYVASVNHTMSFLAPCRADDWLYVEADGVNLGDGRAMAQARVWTGDGQEVVRMAQECAVADRV